MPVGRSGVLTFKSSCWTVMGLDACHGVGACQRRVLEEVLPGGVEYLPTWWSEGVWSLVPKEEHLGGSGPCHVLPV